MIRPKNRFRFLNFKVRIELSKFQVQIISPTMTSSFCRENGRFGWWRHKLTELRKEGPDSSIALCNSPKAYEYVQHQNKFQIQSLQGGCKTHSRELKLNIQIKIQNIFFLTFYKKKLKLFFDIQLGKNYHNEERAAHGRIHSR